MRPRITGLKPQGEKKVKNFNNSDIIEIFRQCYIFKKKIWKQKFQFKSQNKIGSDYNTM